MIRTFLILCFVSLPLVACADNNDNNNSTTEAPSDNTTETAEDTQQNATSNETNEAENEPNGAENNQTQSDDMAAKMDKLPFYDISLDVQYSDNKDYEVSIDREDNGAIKAELEDDLNDQYLRGEEAFDFIYERIKNVNITSDSTTEEITQELVQAFNLPEDYVEFEAEIKFDDGKEIKIEQ